MVVSASITELLDAGYALVPIPLGSKSPTHEGWNQRDQAVTSSKEAHLFHGRNVGLLHAYSTPAPTCALDIDNYPLAAGFLAQHGINLNELLLSGDSVVIWSGKKHSIKTLYRLPVDLGPLPTRTVRGADRKTILELRCAAACGTSMQDVLPPSLHPSGTVYRWMGDGSPLEIPTIPCSLLGLWQNLRMPSRTVRSTTPSKQIHDGMAPLEETPRNVARVIRLLDDIDADCDYETYRTVIWAVESLNWDCGEELQRGWSLTAEHRFEEQTLQNLKASFKTGDGCITFGSLVYMARQARSAA